MDDAQRGLSMRKGVLRYWPSMVPGIILMVNRLSRHHDITPSDMRLKIDIEEDMARAERVSELLMQHAR